MKNKNKIIGSVALVCGLVTIAPIISLTTTNSMNNAISQDNLAISHTQDQSPFNLANATITVTSKNLVYNGERHLPDFYVTDSAGNIPRFDIDYNIRYYNNVDAGTGTIEILGMKEYYGTKKATFKIGKAMDNSIFNFHIGEDGFPHAEAKYGQVKFKYSEDDGKTWLTKLPYRGYKYIAKAYVDDNKNFNGVESKNTLEFIRPQTFDISKAQINLSYDSTTYTGKQMKPGVAVIDVYHILVQGKDFDVQYQNNINAGTATVIVKGKGLYKGSQRKTFTINKDKNVISNLVLYHNEPHATAKYGYVNYRYSQNKKDWILHYPTPELGKGKWYIQGFVEEGDNYLAGTTPNMLEIIV